MWILPNDKDNMYWRTSLRKLVNKTLRQRIKARRANKQENLHLDKLKKLTKMRISFECTQKLHLSVVVNAMVKAKIDKKTRKTKKKAEQRLENKTHESKIETMTRTSEMFTYRVIECECEEN